jgi:hypothetical protein
LTRFLNTRHPGDQQKIYHGAGHSYEVANFTAQVVKDQPLSADRKVLMVFTAALHDIDPTRVPDTPARVAATLSYLDSDPEAKALIADFGGRFGFTAAQVKALIMATDFSPDPAEMKAKQDAFVQAAGAAFPGDDFGLIWGRRLAFVDQSSTYLAGPTFAQNRVMGLAHEIRSNLEVLGKGPGPTNEQMLAGTAKFLSVLKQSPNFALLPPDLKKQFERVSAYFETRQTPEAWTAATPARAPPAAPDLEAAKRYIRSIAGSIALDDRQTDGLLTYYFEEEGIAPGSPQAEAVRKGLLPSKVAAEDESLAGLSPRLRKHRAALLRLAADRRTTPAAIEAVLARRGVLDSLAGLDRTNFLAQAERALNRDELESAVAGYPDNAQGDFMRSLAGNMASPSGKSIEETTREGAFAYVDFTARSVARASTGRNPDAISAQMVFYVVREGGRWKIGGYRQNKRTGRSDDELIRILRRWLVAGDIPSGDLE